MSDNDIYLGDGVYFVPDPYQAKLYTGDGENEANVIFLSAHVATALVRELKKWLGE